MAQNLSEEELADEERTSPEGDPGDLGIPNLLRYAFALDARNPDRVGLPRIGMQSGENGRFLTLEFNRPSHAIDLDYRIETSTDLAEWETADGIWETVPGGNGTVDAAVYIDNENIADNGSDRRYNENIADNGSDRRFLRAAVRLTETD